ncbi:MAG: ParA family protein [Deltaproteobacteria bacterium]|nr:ParA family protein [Deltaproteobacteria bacterium]
MKACRIIVAMPKGGSGKTATAVALAWGFERRGRRVLLVDLDPQGNATCALGASQEGGYGTLELLLRPERPFTPRPITGGLHVVPASSWRAGADLEVQAANQVTGPVAVREALARVEGAYDYVICDCAPSLGPVTYNALAAGPVLVPVEMTRLAVSVVPELDRVLATIRRGVAPKAGVLGYLPIRHVEHQEESRDALRSLAALEGHRVLKTRVPAATAIARSLAEGISLFSPRYRRSRGPTAYLAVVDEVAQLLEDRHE